MALRIRKNGSIMCAAMHSPEPGDTYIDDQLHYDLSIEHRVLVTEPHERHQFRGEWWWVGNVPEDIILEPFRVRPAEVSDVQTTIKQTFSPEEQPGF